MPGLCLTKPQVRRLWNLDLITTEAVLQRLETSGFLRRTRAGAYVLADS
jgi:predicted transcriptional regulator of viral defense system